MNEQARKYLDMFRKGRSVSMATVDEDGRPQSRIIDVMIVNDDGMYIISSRGKEFHKQLTEKEDVAMSYYFEETCVSLRFLGKVKKVETKWLDEVFVQNPGMNEVYPGETRYALDCFLVYQGHGEFFDLSKNPIYRERFAYGGDEVAKVGFKIMDNCVSCGVCVEHCPQKCISEGSPYEIKEYNCLHCGHCFEYCPVGAVEKC
ncbi:MAG: 4Fe-4S binding protein [Clostridia bacterium]